MTDAARRPRLSLIAAVARNGVIGDQGQLLWRLPEDMQFFKATTMGHPVVMGRKTWDSLPARFRPLPGRRNLVATRQSGWQAEGAEACNSLSDALARCDGADVVYVIGGGELYAQALPLADELVLTEIDADYDGDARFPPWQRDDWGEVSRQTHRAAAPNDFDFAFVTYRRRTPTA